MMNNSIRLFFLFAIAVCFLLVFYVFTSALPESTIGISRINKIRITSIIPEGWAFFTKNPQSEDAIIYEVKDSSINKIILPSGDVSNLFGLNRRSRLQSQELGNLLTTISEDSWVYIQGSLTDSISLIKRTVLIDLINPSKYPYFRGVYVVQKIVPIPWAWYKSFDLTKRPSKFIVINVHTSN
jgi:antimicrobial peptide system SdpA family protein